MRIRLSEERKELLVEATQQLFLDEFERDLSPFQSRRLVDFFIEQLGPPVYNQAVQDARRFMLGKLEDLDGEIYEPEPSP